MKKRIISAFTALAIVSGLAVVPSYAMTKDDFVDTYAEVYVNNNFDTETQSDSAPDGSAGYKKITAETNLWSSSEISYTNDFLASLDFRFDDVTGNLVIKNNNNNIGPNITFSPSNENPNVGTLRTQTGSSSYQDLASIDLGKWYTMEIQGKMHVSGASAVFRLYEWDTTAHTKTLKTTVNSINLRNFGGTGQKSDPNKLIVSGGLSVDNDYFAQLYPDSVTVAPVSGTDTEIIAGGSLALSAMAMFEDKQSTYQSFDWAVYNEDGTAPETDTKITVSASGVVQVNKRLEATKNVRIRATSKTKGAPYAEYSITAVYNEAAANDKYDDLTLSTDRNRNYVREGDPLVITATGKDDQGVAVSEEDVKSDIEWSIMNAGKTRTVTNDNITIEDGVLSVNENAVAQNIVVKATNKSKSIERFFEVAVRPYNMNIAGETAYTDTYESSDAFEEPTTNAAITFHEDGSADGSAYYEVNSGSTYDCVGFNAKTNKDVMFSADMKFPVNFSGMEIQDGSGHLGMIVSREHDVIGNRSGSYNEAKPTSNYNDFVVVDPDAWYNVTIIASAGHNKDGDNAASYATLVLYKYVNGEKVNPSNVTSTEPMVKGLSLRNLDKEQAKMIHLYAGTCVDNVVNAYVSPNNFTIKVDPDIVLAGNTAQATATARWNMVDMPNLSSDTVEFAIYDSDDQYPIESDDITIDSNGKITVTSMAAAQDVYVGVKAKNADTHTSAKLTIKSSDIFEIKGVGFNEDYSKLVAIDVDKVYTYDKEVTFVIAVYDRTKTLKFVNIKTAYGSDIPDGSSTVNTDIDMTAFDKDNDSLKVYTWTKLK